MTYLVAYLEDYKESLYCSLGNRDRINQSNSSSNREK